MNSFKRYGRILAVGLFLVPISNVFAGTESASDLKLGTPQPRADFYFKVDSGAVFFRPPDKDNGNFSEAADPTEQTDGATPLSSQSGDDTTWSLGATIGFYLPGQPTESWMGKNLRIEASGNYFQASSTQNSDLSVSPSGTFLAVGRLDGNYLGTNVATDIGSLSAGPNPVASEELRTQDEFYQAGMAVRSDYIFDRGQLVLSLRLGFQYSHLDQDFHTSALGSRGAVDQKEDISTDYFGPTFGLELKVQLTKIVVYYAEGEMSPFYATSDYTGNQEGISSRFGGGALQNSASDSKDTFAFKAGFTTGFYFDFKSVVLKFGGGFEYWDYVATVKEASLPTGADAVDGASGPFTIQPSHLVSSDMLNPTIKMSIIVPF